MSKSGIGLLLTCAFVLLAVTNAFAADSISVTVGSDPTEEVPVPLTVNFTSADTGARAYVTVKPAGPLGCAPNYGADDPTSSDVLWSSSTGASTNRTFSEPGVFVLCGYLQSSSPTVPLAVTGPISMTIRAARASIALTVPPRVDTDQAFKFTAAVTTELARRVFLTIKPVGGRGCESTYALDDPNSTDVDSRQTQGTQTLDITTTAPRTAARYLLCAYVQEDSGDPAPEATTSAEILVGPDPCVTARGAVAKANRDVRVAEGSVARNRVSWRRYSAAARSARGYRRKVLRDLSRRAKSRYASAVRRRAAARGRLAAAQAAVTANCPA